MSSIAKRIGTHRGYPLKANQLIEAGHAVFLLAGLAVGFSAATNAATYVGIAPQFTESPNLADGEVKIEVDATEVKFANAGDINHSHVGSQAYFASARTLSVSSSTNTRAPAGIITQVDEDGVWVKAGV